MLPFPIQCEQIDPIIIHYSNSTCVVLIDDYVKISDVHSCDMIGSVRMCVCVV